jgi:putative PIN family toxin of toxin-antitoxin system
MSEELFSEVENVLKREKIYKKYNLSTQEISGFLTELRNSTVIVTPLPKDQLPLHSRDPEDDKFLACAFGGTCNYLITGDRDLLDLKGDKALGKLEIIKATDFLKRLG